MNETGKHIWGILLGLSITLAFTLPIACADSEEEAERQAIIDYWREMAPAIVANILYLNDWDDFRASRGLSPDYAIQQLNSFNSRATEL